MPSGRTQRLRRGIGRAAAIVAARARGEGGTYAWEDPSQVHLRIEQPPSRTNAPRWGHGKPPQPDLARLLARFDAAIVERVERMLSAYGGDLAKIDRGHRQDGQPCWGNPMTTGLDGASIYGFVRERAPRTYLEVGSGYSTTFAARARADGALATRIVSIDPEPRTEIDRLCDEVVRERLEATDLSVFGDLGPGDIVFFDGSHRVFMDNDVSAFFVDVLPRLHPEVLVAVHDVYLPDDYFPEHGDRYWTEQYLLAMALLAGGAEPVLPCHYVCVEHPEPLNAAWQAQGLGGINAYGSAFWFHPRMQVG